MPIPAFLLVCLLTPIPGAPQSTPLETGMRNIDRLAAVEDSRPAVVSAIAGALGVHRNHVVLLRKETGQPYGLLFVRELQKLGVADDAIATRLHTLERDIQQRIAQDRAGTGGPPASGVRPVLSLNTGVDYNSAATFLWFNAEAGVDSAHASLVAGVPYYRDSSGGTAVSGVGDAYLLGSLFGRAARMDLAASLTVGMPSGDKDLGLGAGKVTADLSGTVAHAFGRVRPFAGAGFANSIFNFAYQRPYIADGNAAHFSGGADLRVAPQLSLGAGGFAVIPSGAQVVYSRIVTAQTPGAQTAVIGKGGAPGSGGSGYGSGNGSGGPPSSTPAKAPPHMPFLANAVSTPSAADLRDYGAKAWAAVSLGRGVSLHFSVARSVPFQLTTARAGLGLDLPRLLFPSRW